MPSPQSRRMRTFGLTVVLVVLIVLYMTSGARQTQDSEFYTKTANALQEKKDTASAALRNTDNLVQQRLKEAEAQAKQAADTKAEPYKEELMQAHKEAKEETVRLAAEKAMSKEAEESDEHKGEKSVAGRKYMKDESVQTPKTSVELSSEKDTSSKGKAAHVQTQEEREVEEELNTILKKSPIIIFSKSYCPYSKKAKHIMLEVYSITPPPYVVELDQHKLGAQLQAKLADMTGRRTVPNVLINGKSIGGGDDIADLHMKNNLINTVKSMGGKRIMEAKLVDEEAKPGLKKRD